MKWMMGMAAFSVLLVSPTLACAPQDGADAGHVRKSALALYADSRFGDARYTGVSCDDFGFRSQLSSALQAELCPYLETLIALGKVTSTDEKLIREGPIFIGSYEGMTGHEIENVTVSDGRAEVMMALSFQYEGEIARWTDQMIWVKQDGQWKLDDIIFDYGTGEAYNMRESIVSDEITRDNARTYLAAE
ncbi:hypothetical protein ACFOWX_13140 [Sphingorhabdus arenilitoris]|uniref:DUF3828 domain-containing protein n=1 Tax=Sphingorhabdus arenilitoris TaxID=1490041 RepID=A0ABV8RJY1_9SPHN